MLMNEIIKPLILAENSAYLLRKWKRGNIMFSRMGGKENMKHEMMRSFQRHKRRMGIWKIREIDDYIVQ